jgi:alcohol dehydrogenase
VYSDIIGSMNFTVSRMPELACGVPAAKAIAKALSSSGSKRVFVAAGRRSFHDTPARPALEKALSAAGIAVEYGIVSGEPTPESIDALVAALKSFGADSVCGIGGGSALDTAKALAAMAVEAGSVADFLEDVGTRLPSGRRLPLFMAPTTAGTGSEATKNAVLSRVGENGFKKSLRHDGYMPDFAVLDPVLAAGCPPEATAASGLDAVTQLLESYVSSKASPLTDALALEGLFHAGLSLEKAVRSGSDLEARAGMAYAAYLSGVCLSNAGLGAVHGMAGVLGGIHPIPHGVACGTLLSATTAALVSLLEDKGDADSLAKFGLAGLVLSGKSPAFGSSGGIHGGSTSGSGRGRGGGTETGIAILLELLERWTADFGMKRLSAFGVGPAELASIAAASGNKNAPAALPPAALESILRERL